MSTTMAQSWPTMRPVEFNVVETCRGDEGEHDGGAIGAALGLAKVQVIPLDALRVRLFRS